MPLSRRTFDEKKRYKTLLFQEDTPGGDFEMVELQDIQNAEREGFIKDFIVDGAVGSGFQALGAGLNGAVKIDFGDTFSLGRRLIMPDSTHQEVGGEFIFNFAIPTPVTNRTDLIYIEILEEEIDNSVDPTIVDPSLGPTAFRERVRYIFRISEGGTVVPTLPVGSVGLPIAFVVRRAGDPQVNAADVTDARQLASLGSQFKPQNLIIVSPEGGDFTSPQDALDSIVGSGPDNPFTILIRPGVYVLNSELSFANSHVQMIGTDPNACVIEVDNTSGSPAAIVNADEITISNLKLGFQPGSTGDASTILINGAFNAKLEDLILSEDFYNENETNALSGIETLAADTVTVRRCRIYQQGAGFNEAVEIGAATMILEDCTIQGADRDTILKAAGGPLTMRRCTVNTNKTLLVCSGQATIVDCEFLQTDVKSFVIGADPVFILSGSVTNRMTNCLWSSASSGTPDNSSSTAATLLWTNVDMRAMPGMNLSGGGASKFENCYFKGIDVNGSSADFEGCEFISGATWSIALLTGAAALIIRAGANCRVMNCRTPQGGAGVVNQNVAIFAADPLIQGCHFFVGASAVAILINSSAKPVISGCNFEYVLAHGGNLAIDVRDALSDPTVVHCHMQGSSLGLPPSWIGGLAGSKVNVGQNTGNTASLSDGTIAKTNIDQS